MHVASLITGNGISILLDGEHYVIPTDHPNYERIVRSLEEKDYTKLRSLCDLTTVVTDWIGNYPDLALSGGVLTLNNVPFGEEVSQKVFDMIEAGNDALPLVNFLRKVRKNPSSTAQKELLMFCVANGFMIHENGNIVAYKGVSDSYMDIHSGKIYNGVGAVVTMDRGLVDDNRNQTCSHGLHFAAFEYASTWAGSRIKHLMVMSIDPADVVSIPSDYNNQKGRCCRYEVVAEVKNFKPLPDKEVYTDNDFLEWDDEDFLGAEDFCPGCGGEVQDHHAHCPWCGELL